MAARRRSETLLVTTIRAGERSRHPDELIVEEPMTVQLDGITVSTTMRTPGNDYELAVGFCHTEGLLAGSGDPDRLFAPVGEPDIARVPPAGRRCDR